MACGVLENRGVGVDQSVGLLDQEAGPGWSCGRRRLRLLALFDHADRRLELLFELGGRHPRKAGGDRGGDDPLRLAANADKTSRPPRDLADNARSR